MGVLVSEREGPALTPVPACAQRSCGPSRQVRTTERVTPGQPLLLPLGEVCRWEQVCWALLVPFTGLSLPSIRPLLAGLPRGDVWRGGSLEQGLAWIG